MHENLFDIIEIACDLAAKHSFGEPLSESVGLNAKVNIYKIQMQKRARRLHPRDILPQRKSSERGLELVSLERAARAKQMRNNLRWMLCIL